MAEKPNTTATQHGDDIAQLDATSTPRQATAAPPASRATEAAQAAQLAFTQPVQRNLPLRQAMQQARAPPPQPKIVDITESFTKACSALKVGELIKDEHFTLFESIAALEIMDPKMDSGFLQPGETLEEDYDVLAPLLPEEVVGIMDQLLCYEMAWHTGYPLSQTLLTSVYIDKLLWPEPKRVDQAQFYRGVLPDSKKPGPLLEVLRAYCLGLVKCCDFVVAKVTSRDYFEEEDFCPQTYHRTLFPQVPMDLFLMEMDEALDVLHDSSLAMNGAIREALISRLQFRKAFLWALDIESSLGALQDTWDPVVSFLSHITTTQQLGKLVPGSFSTKIQRRLASTVPPRPIVELDFKDASEKLKQLCVDCKEATRFISLPPDPLEFESFLWAYAFRNPAPLPYSRSYMATILFHPDTLNTPVSLPLIDLKTIVFPPNSPVLDPANWALPPPLPPPFNATMAKPPHLRIAHLIDEAVERAGNPYLAYWTALGQNQCRLRRMLVHVIEDWNLLQTDAAELDEDLHGAVVDAGIAAEMLPNPLTTWALLKKLGMVERVVSLGFEMDVFLPDEFAEMYHFLSLVCTTRISILEDIWAHHKACAARQAGKGNSDAAAEIEYEAGYVESQLEVAKGTKHLAAALSTFYTVLLYLKLLPHPKRPFSSAALRYELRMRPFLTLQPPVVPPFSEFETQTQRFGPYDSPSEAFEEALRDSKSQLWTDIDAHIKEAKDAFTGVKKIGAAKARAGSVEAAWTKEVNGALASCVALGVAAVGIRAAAAGAAATERGGDGEGKRLDLGLRYEIPEMNSGKRYSESWIVGRVVKVGQERGGMKG